MASDSVIVNIDRQITHILLARFLLVRIEAVRGEIEHMAEKNEQRVLDMRIDLLDEIEEACRQIVTKGEQ